MSGGVTVVTTAPDGSTLSNCHCDATVAIRRSRYGGRGMIGETLSKRRAGTADVKTSRESDVVRYYKQALYSDGSTTAAQRAARRARRPCCEMATR